MYLANFRVLIVRIPLATTITTTTTSRIRYTPNTLPTHSQHTQLTDQMLNMFVWWMEQALAALPEDKTQITFLFDRTGVFPYFCFLSRLFPYFCFLSRLLQYFCFLSHFFLYDESHSLVSLVPAIPLFSRDTNSNHTA